MSHALNEYQDSKTLRPGGCSLEIGSPGPGLLKKIAEYLDVSKVFSWRSELNASALDGNYISENLTTAVGQMENTGEENLALPH